MGARSGGGARPAGASTTGTKMEPLSEFIAARFTNPKTAMGVQAHRKQWAEASKALGSAANGKTSYDDAKFAVRALFANSKTRDIIRTYNDALSGYNTTKASTLVTAKQKAAATKNMKIIDQIVRAELKRRTKKV